MTKIFMFFIVLVPFLHASKVAGDALSFDYDYKNRTSILHNEGSIKINCTSDNVEFVHDLIAKDLGQILYETGNYLLFNSKHKEAALIYGLSSEFDRGNDMALYRLRLAGLYSNNPEIEDFSGKVLLRRLKESGERLKKTTVAKKHKAISVLLNETLDQALERKDFLQKNINCSLAKIESNVSKDSCFAGLVNAAEVWPLIEELATMDGNRTIEIENKIQTILWVELRLRKLVEDCVKEIKTLKTTPSSVNEGYEAFLALGRRQ